MSTASLAWVFTNYLMMSQPSTCVSAFSYLQKKCKVSSGAQTKHVFQPRRQSSLNYRNKTSQVTLKGPSQNFYLKVIRSPFSTNAGRWKTSTIRGQVKDEQNSSSEKDNQFIVDDYLESIDRRYKRVHRSENEDDRQNMGFTSTLTWLVSERKHENENDALHILDLAELASVRLLHKHSLPVTNSQRKSRTSEDHSVIDVKEMNDRTTPSISTVVKSLAQFLNTTKRICIYPCASTSLQFRVWYNQALRCSRSNFSQILESLSLRSTYMRRVIFPSLLVLLVTFGTVLFRP